LRFDSGRDVNARDLEEQRQMREGRPECGRLDGNVRHRIQQRIAERRLETGRQLSLHLTTGGCGCKSVELIAQAWDRICALRIEFDCLIGAWPQKQEPQLLGWD